MSGMLLAARLILALVLAVAGLAKLADPRGSRQAMVGFGVPEALAGATGLLLPLLELAIAVALISTRTAWAASVAAGALLLLFILGIGVNLLRGRRPDCHCFGQLHSEPIGPGTIARNVVLLALAVWIAVAGRSGVGASALTWIANLRTAEQVGLGLAIVAFALIGLQLWLLLDLMQQNGRLLVRLEALETGTDQQPALSSTEPAPTVHGLPVGTPAPAFDLPGLHGETITLAALLAQGNPTLLLFTSAGCGPCSALMPDIGRWQREARDRLTVALIAGGGVEANRAKAVEHGLINVLAQEENEVAGVYRSPGTPSAVLIGLDGTIAQPMAAGADAIRALVTAQLAVPRQAPQPAQVASLSAPVPPPVAAAMPNGHQAGSVTLGMPAPDFNLPDRTGRQVTLTDLRGSETLLLFWNTGCGFCRQMLDDLKAWERERPNDDHRIVVFSSGPLDDVRALGLQSTVIPDPGFSYGPRFGAGGTPMAVLLDREGRVASGVAAGASAVLALARGGNAAGEGPLIPLQAEAPPRNGNGLGPITVRRGEPAPAIQLPDLDGKMVSLADFRGHPTLVLFWNTGCGFCRRMLPDLLQWEARRTADSPQLLVVSAGSAEDTRAMGLRSTVVLDAGGSTGPRYGANGTPMAVLVDAEGNIDSEVAAGAEAVLALATAAPTAVRTVRNGEW